MKPKTTKGVKKPVTHAYGILNAYGEFWTARAFATKDEALNYISQWELKNTMLPNHTVIPVKISPL